MGHAMADRPAPVERTDGSFAASRSMKPFSVVMEVSRLLHQALALLEDERQAREASLPDPLPSRAIH
jgi:hypothetical protein